MVFMTRELYGTGLVKMEWLVNSWPFFYMVICCRVRHMSVDPTGFWVFGLHGLLWPLSKLGGMQGDENDLARVMSNI